MSFTEISALIGCIAGVGSAFALIFWVGRQFQKLNILWGFYTKFSDFFLFQGLKRVLERGWGQELSSWQLTEEGERVLPNDLKREIEALIPSLKPDTDISEDASFIIRKLDMNKFRSLALQGLSFQEALALVLIYTEQLKSKRSEKSLTK
jgi:hypothetical protein